MRHMLTRTKHLDMHVAKGLREKAKRMRASHLADNKRYGYIKDIDTPVIRELARRFSPLHQSTSEIRDYIGQQDTAVREMVPQLVYDILKKNITD